jgi:hypothetical protein
MEPSTPARSGDEWVLDHPTLRRFIEYVNTVRRRETDPQVIIATIRPAFAELLADQSWLPQQYQEPAVRSGMGSGIGTWLLYRAADGGLALSALVVPPGAQTPVHDHLAWWASTAVSRRKRCSFGGMMARRRAVLCSSWLSAVCSVQAISMNCCRKMISIVCALSRT